MNITTTHTFSDLTKQAMHIAGQLAREHKHGSYGGPHLLKALMHRDLGLLQQLNEAGADPYYIEEWAEIRLEQYPKSVATDEPEPDALCAAVFNEAEHLQNKLGYYAIEPECLLAALATPGVYFSYEQLKTFPFTATQAIEFTGAAPAIAPINGNTGSSSKNNAKTLSKSSSENIKKYCIDRLQEFDQKKEPDIIGRKNEIRQLYEIISRKSKSNVLLVGEPGVGKSAMLDGFVSAAANKLLPTHLSGVALFQLDNGALIAGASYKGEQEDRMRKIIKELTTLDKPVLFIDEIHTLIDKNNNSGVAAILKSELANGLITIIATTTTDEYRKTMEKEPTFNRQFEVVKIEEPHVEVVEQMLKQKAISYQQHYDLTIEESVYPDAIRLAKRFVKDKKLPDAALDLLDRTLAASKIMIETATADIENFSDKINALNEEDGEEKINWLYYEMRTGLSPVLLGQYNEEQDYKKLTDVNIKLKHLRSMIDGLYLLAKENKTSINSTDLHAVVAHITGIPIGKIQTKDQQRLIAMEDHLRERVIGQDHALKTVSEAIVESRSGLNKAGQPIASFFFLGPTGTGKTELAKSLAEFLFQDENSIIRFDMSEFKEEHSAALLYGAPPGYVGYEEGGMLVNKIRQQPYAIVLFDEIEKAHPSVFDIFLQVLDEGKMHDRLGKEGDFSNAVILFTSNIGAEHIISSFDKGHVPASDELMEIMSPYFRPEFLARVTEIIPFAPISTENVVNIFKIHLKPLLKQLEQKGIELTVSEEAARHLAFLGFTPKYGVRPLKGVIRNELRKPLSRMLVREEVCPGDKVHVQLKDEMGKTSLDWKITAATINKP